MAAAATTRKKMRGLALGCLQPAEFVGVDDDPNAGHVGLEKPGGPDGPGFPEGPAATACSQADRIGCSAPLRRLPTWAVNAMPEKDRGATQCRAAGPASPPGA